jgi:hypothetical protein
MVSPHLFALLWSLAVRAAPTIREAQQQPDYETCAEVSKQDFAWEVQNLEYHAYWDHTTPAHLLALGTISFDLFNPSVSRTVTCRQQSSRLNDFFDGNEWYTCSGSSGIPNVEFRFLSHSRLDIKESWICRGARPGDG